MKILAVDDSIASRALVKEALEKEGHEVLEAEDGATALTALESHGDVQVIIIEWHMPVMNGIECLRQLRKCPKHQAVKVLMCTSVAEKKSIMEAIKAGANGYILKPVKPETIVEQVAKVAA